MDFRRIGLTALVVILFVSGCALLIRLPLVQDSVREGLIMPVLFLVWLLGLILRSIDQQTLWAVALVMLSLLLIYGLTMAWPTRPARQNKTLLEEEQPPPVHGKVNYWQNKISTLRNQGVDSEYANYDFRRLSQDVVETTAGPFTPPEPPDEIAVFFTRSVQTNAPPDKPHWRGFSRRKPPPAGDPLAELCNYLEDQLEIDHDTQH